MIFALYCCVLVIISLLAMTLGRLGSIINALNRISDALERGEQDV